MASEVEHGDERVALARLRPFRLGAAEVRPATREVVVGGTTETVEPRVMQVLVALARAGGEVVTRDDLIESCWDGRIVTEDAIARVISKVRRLAELSDPPAWKLDTINKVGFRLLGGEGGLASASAELPPSKTPPQRGLRLAAAAAALAILLAAAAGYWLFSAGRGPSSSPAGRPPVIAVLPFANLSADKDQAYFSDGLSEELIAQLSQVDQLRVIGRTSTFALRDSRQDVRAIGDRLGATHLLEGSVRRAGDRLRITAQLVNAADGLELWSQTYDRRLVDVFAVQDEIAAAVAGALKGTLAVGPARVDYGGTASFEAYDQFLRGRTITSDATADLPARLDHLQRAVRIDPNYALAWANLAFGLWLADSAAGRPRSQNPERVAALKRALALAPDLAAAHIADGIDLIERRDWKAADAAFGRAVRVGGDPGADNVAGGFMMATGRSQEGRALRERGRAADPLDPVRSRTALGAYLALRDWPSFDAEYERGRGLGGLRWLPEYMRVQRLVTGGASPDAIDAQLTRLAQTDGRPPFIRAWVSTRQPDTEVLAGLRRAMGAAAPRELIWLAEVAAMHGDIDLAFEALFKAEPAVSTASLQTIWNPSLGPLRTDRRFNRLMEQTGLPKFWRESGKWPDYCKPVGVTDFTCR